MEKLKQNLHDYIKDKTWYWYIPLWFFCLYVFYAIIRFNPDSSSLLLAPIQAFSFWLHEGGHAVTMWLPSVVTASAGSLSEMLLGIVLVVTAFKTRYYFSALFCSMWLAFGFKSAGLYMADARSQKLELVSPFGDNAIHDWHFVFSKLHLLKFDTLIGGAIKWTGYVVTLALFGFSAWLIYRFAGSKDEEAKMVAAKEVAARLKSSSGFDGPTLTKGKIMANGRSVSSIYPDATSGALAEPPEAPK